MRPMGRNTLGWIMMLCGSLGVFCISTAGALAHLGPAPTQRSVYLWAGASTAALLSLLVVTLRLLRRRERSSVTQNGRRETPGARSAMAADTQER